MYKLKIFLKRPEIILLILIISIGTFFRTYRLIERFEFAHDGDLFSWIARDIIVNHHFRLIGQETSAPGIFIGPMYYYLNVPFFLVAEMSPIGAVIPISLISILAIFSYYWVFKTTFSTTVGLFASFIYSTSLYAVTFDKRIVPSTPTNLWIIWYCYVVINLARGKFAVMPILAILIGLIWHIHIALLPTLIAVPIALIFARKIPQKKQFISFFIVLILVSLPLIIFETRHGFSQTKSLLNNFSNSFSSGNTIEETRKVFLGSENKNGSFNLDPASKYTLEIAPSSPNLGDKVHLKITTKNSKYSTNIIYLDCGNPRIFEIGYVTAEYDWDTKGCSLGEHALTVNGRVAMDPVWKKFATKGVEVLQKENRNINSMLLHSLDLPQTMQYAFTFIILISPLIVWWIKGFSYKEVGVFYGWIIGVFIFFTISSIAVSEYYLASVDVILILTVSLILTKLYLKKYGKYVVISFIVFMLIKNFSEFISQPYYQKGYVERQSTMEYIQNDMATNGYPCISISYIASQGENIGFRYLLWLNHIQTVNINTGAPIYNIVIPEELSPEVDRRFGHIGVILPKNPVDRSTPEKIQRACQQEDTNLTDSMFGYTR